MLRMPSAVVATDDRGEIDYRDLHRLLHVNRDRPAVVVANIGTTMTEAVDDVGQILTAIRNVGISGHYIHSDAALAGIPLALTSPRPMFDLADGADSISVSGHKFIGSPFPSGVVITRRSSRDLIMRDGTYTGSPDTTITGSRSGHAPLLLWHAIQTHGSEGLRRRADQSRELAAYATARLQEIGWDAWRNPHAFTVVLRTPPETVTKTWTLAATGEWSHLICMPGITRDQIDQFVADMTLATQPLVVR
jgi:histidine decarboxylase